MPTLKELERWMSTGQVANRLGRSRQGVLKLAEEKRLRAVCTAVGWLYDPKDVERFASDEHSLRQDKMTRQPYTKEKE